MLALGVSTPVNFRAFSKSEMPYRNLEKPPSFQTPSVREDNVTPVGLQRLLSPSLVLETAASGAEVAEGLLLNIAKRNRHSGETVFLPNK